MPASADRAALLPSFDLLRSLCKYIEYIYDTGGLDGHRHRDRAGQHPAMRSEQMNAPWIRSSFSFANGNCVEVAELPGDSVGIRDSRDPGGPVLSFTRAEWAAFLGRQVATCRSCRTPRS